MHITNETEKIKQFWDDQAQKHGTSSLATMPDSIAFELELAQLEKMIPPGSRVLDLGCGNGVKGIWLTKRIPFTYVGIDYSHEMIKQAHILIDQEKNTLQGTVRFEHGDMLDEQMIDEKEFDFIISVRSLINVGDVQNQLLAVKNAHAFLKESGTYLMIENSQQALRKINTVRQQFGLPDIQERWHNVFLDEETFFETIAPYFKVCETINFESTYFLISRTLNAVLTPEGETVDFHSKLNQLAAKLPPLGDYSPRKLFVLKKIGEAHV